MKWEVENSDTHGQEKNMKEWEVGHVEEKKGVSGRWKQGRNKLKKNLVRRIMHCKIKKRVNLDAEGG